MEDTAAVPEIDTSRPHAARIYEYFLGGKNHFAADREMAGKILQNMPSIRTTARENRAFLGHAVRYLAAEAGIRQFLDIGTGLPTTGRPSPSTGNEFTFVTVLLMSPTMPSCHGCKPGCARTQTAP